MTPLGKAETAQDTKCSGLGSQIPPGGFTHAQTRSPRPHHRPVAIRHARRSGRIRSEMTLTPLHYVLYGFLAGFLFCAMLVLYALTKRS